MFGEKARALALGCVGVLMGLELGCGGSDAGPSAQSAKVVREVFDVPGVTAPANPVSNKAAPAAQEVTRVVRYRAAGEAREPRAILLAMPAASGGAGSFDGLAVGVVTRALARGEPVEVWAIDRRANMLEDSKGMDRARAEHDPELAEQYYFEGSELGGQSFGGFVQPAAAPWMSEWGLAVHVADLERVLALIPAEARRGHVFLLGHSLGAAFAEAFAGWRFEDGHRGFDELAGVVLLEGKLGFQSTPIQEADYHAGFSAEGQSVPGLEAIRGGQTFAAVPIIGTKLFPLVEIQAMRAEAHPRMITPDATRDSALQLLLVLSGDIPKMTDAAALGFMLDGQHSMSGAYSMGHGTGGPFADAALPSGATISHPSDPSATYDWVDALDATPPEWTPAKRFADGAHDGTNQFEWYTPWRLFLDLSAAAPGNLPSTGWQADAGLRVFDSSSIDLPVLAVSASGYSVADYDAVKARLAPSIGADRPHAGATRDQEVAFRAFHVDMLHADVAAAADSDANPLPKAVLDFALDNAAPGNVSVSAP